MRSPASLRSLSGAVSRPGPVRRSRPTLCSHPAHKAPVRSHSVSALLLPLSPPTHSPPVRLPLTVCSPMRTCTTSSSSLLSMPSSSPVPAAGVPTGISSSLELRLRRAPANTDRRSRIIFRRYTELIWYSDRYSITCRTSSICQYRIQYYRQPFSTLRYRTNPAGLRTACLFCSCSVPTSGTEQEQEQNRNRTEIEQEQEQEQNRNRTGTEQAKLEQENTGHKYSCTADYKDKAETVFYSSV
uniref:Uncharacterized protein n=1 Tax=Globodera rostochiensis TaxID=31243 RepID=A0A914HWC2_GLORO